MLVQMTTDYLQTAIPSGEYLGWLAVLEADPATVIGGAGVQLRHILPFPYEGSRGSTIAEGHQAIVLNMYTDPTWPAAGEALPRARAALFHPAERRYGTDRSKLGVMMFGEMGTFRIDVELENPLRPDQRAVVQSLLVDTGSELSWIPAGILESLGIERRKLSRFRQASGTILERWTGLALIYAAGTSTADEVVFGQPGDPVLLGSLSLEGLNLRVDPVSKTLVDAGPAPAAVGE